MLEKGDALLSHDSDTIRQFVSILKESHSVSIKSASGIMGNDLRHQRGLKHV